MDIAVYITAGVAVVAFIIYLVIRRERKRREELQLAAQTLGYQYTQKIGMEAVGEAKSFHLFNTGHSKRIRNMMVREETDIRSLIYDYQYTVGGGRNSHTFIQTVFQFESGRLKLPVFVLRPENIFHKIGQSFGYKDIDFDAYPEFSKKTLLRGEDETAIRKLFSQDLIERLTPEKGLIVEAGGPVLIFYHSSKRVKPDNLRTGEEKMQMLCHAFIRRCEYM